MKVLVTGGAGYIGSTTCAALEDAGHIPVILDSLVTGHEAFTHGRLFYRGDIADRSVLERILKDHPDIRVTIHFAARIVVSESVECPDLYYHDNVVKSLALFSHLIELGQHRLVFSSSASVYSAALTHDHNDLGVTEDSAVGPASPYARTKLMAEQILADLGHATPLRSISLRYFNPIGADPAMRSGPYVPDPSHVLGKLVTAALTGTPFSITGTDYPTRDGTGLRDYIHVWDLARAHVAAVEHFDEVVGAGTVSGYAGSPSTILNVGTGQGVTVRELLTAFQVSSGIHLHVIEAPRRSGDSAGAYAKIQRIQNWLGWSPQLTMTEAIRHALQWENHRAEQTQ